MANLNFVCFFSTSAQLREEYFLLPKFPWKEKTKKQKRSERSEENEKKINLFKKKRKRNVCRP
jgi:hypothetical protein